MISPKKYLNSFYPLVSTRAGKKAVAKYFLPPFIDGSCRREPDFENDYPCITGLCRPGFAEKLNEGDTIIYVTNKKGVGSRKFVAEFMVSRTFKNHDCAANWYRKHHLPIPNNIIVSETKPFDLDKTHKKMGWDTWVKSNDSLEHWNDQYVIRAWCKQKVVQCEIIYRNIHNPPKIDESMLVTRKLVAQNPPILKDDEYLILKNTIR